MFQQHLSDLGAQSIAEYGRVILQEGFNIDGKPPIEAEAALNAAEKFRDFYRFFEEVQKLDYTFQSSFISSKSVSPAVETTTDHGDTYNIQRRSTGGHPKAVESFPGSSIPPTTTL